MSIRLEMFEAARLAPPYLGESASLVRDFFIRQQNPQGGFNNRAGRSDLYYTVFGLEGLLALNAPVDLSRHVHFLQCFGDGETLDYVHLCCLARAWAAVAQTEQPLAPAPHGVSQPPRHAIFQHILRFRSKDGGFHPVLGSPRGTAYGCFLAMGASQDLDVPLDVPDALADCLAFLKTSDGAWLNERPPLPSDAPKIQLAGSTNATAAAVAVLRHLNHPLPQSAGEWLAARHHAHGGFLAMPGAPIPDLLSTATALHALRSIGWNIDPFREPCLSFIDTLWTNAGAFHGHWADDHLDCEYAYYGLLALGHLNSNAPFSSIPRTVAFNR